MARYGSLTNFSLCFRKGLIRVFSLLSALSLYITSPNMTVESRSGVYVVEKVHPRENKNT